MGCSRNFRVDGYVLWPPSRARCGGATPRTATSTACTLDPPASDSQQTPGGGHHLENGAVAVVPPAGELDLRGVVDAVPPDVLFDLIGSFSGLDDVFRLMED